MMGMAFALDTACPMGCDGLSSTCIKPGTTFSGPTSDSPLVRVALEPPGPTAPGSRARLRIDLGPLPGPGM